MYSRILVPIDGSFTAQRGLQEASGLAKALGAGLVLLHVVESTPVMMDLSGSAGWDRVVPTLRAEGKRVLASAHAAADGAGIACEEHLKNTAARVCDVIVEQARAHHCDLIVMGTHGRRGINHVLLGSDAERVIRMSPVPVLLVRADDPA